MRSAIACWPTWTKPITGTSVPRNQNQPVAASGAPRQLRIAAVGSSTRITTAPATCPAANCFGNG